MKLFSCLFLFYGLSNAYDPPIGIPAPPFGIEETVESIHGSSIYTHYVDGSHPSADNDNGNGTAEAPLADPFMGSNSITLPAGSVVEIHGGPYSFDGWKRITSEGTADNPVIFRGADPDNPVRISALDGSHDWRLAGSYLILENLEFFGGAHVRLWEDPDHVSIRNIEVHAPGMIVGFGAGISGSGSDIVVVNSHIHHLWRGDEIDCHGIVPGSGSLRYWILDNHIHENSGDGVQACHQCDPAPRYIYIGRNTIHDDRENAVDLKYADDVVISQNNVYGYEEASTSDGVAMVIGSDGAPNRPWIIFNNIHSSKNGIRVEEVEDVWIIGNLIHDLEGSALSLEKVGTHLAFVNNTVYNADVFIDQFWQENFGLDISDNIIMNMRGENRQNHLHIESDVVYGAAELNNNLFYQQSGDLILNLGNGNNPANFTVVTSQGELDALNMGTGNLYGDPMFTNPSLGDFTLGGTGPAIGAGAEHSAYAAFSTLHPGNIRVDYGGRQRTPPWELGAYEEGTPLSINRRLKKNRVPVSPNPYDALGRKGPGNGRNKFQMINFK